MVSINRTAVKRTAITLVAGTVTTWLTGKAIKEFQLPRATSPIVGLVVTGLVAQAVRRIH